MVGFCILESSWPCRVYEYMCALHKQSRTDEIWLLMTAHMLELYNKDIHMSMPLAADILRLHIYRWTILQENLVCLPSIQWAGRNLHKVHLKAHHKYSCRTHVSSNGRMPLFLKLVFLIWKFGHTSRQRDRQTDRYAYRNSSQRDRQIYIQKQAGSETDRQSNRYTDSWLSLSLPVCKL